MQDQIERILQERVRPALQEHGGDVRVVTLKENVLYLELLGACAHCPSAYLTTEGFIEQELTRAIPYLKRVVLEQHVDESLLEQARRILSKSRTDYAN